MLVEGLVIRESLLEICQEIERAMVSFEARLKALESTGSLAWPPRRRLSIAAAARRAGRAAPPAPRPRILLTTEGTYPYAIGGVSSWCDLLVRGLDEFDWRVLPIVAPRRTRRRCTSCPRTPARSGRSRSGPSGSRAAGARAGRARQLPGVLVRGLLGWNGDTDAVLDEWLWCRRHPAGVRRAFRSGARLGGFLGGLRDVLAERVAEAGTPPRLDLVEAAPLYQTLYWVARTAAAPTPAGRRAARDRGRLVGDPRARAQGAARHADGAHRARRLRARGLPGGGARWRLAGRPLRRDAAGARARALRVRGRRRRSAR